ncbi:MAG: M15 family metallopeptidase [Spirochaetales bacterium]|nr:M15 family metallopeptidase [Spirochaetales bacterium]
MPLKAHQDFEPFLDDMAQVLSENQNLILVDKKNPLPEEWKPTELLSLDSYSQLIKNKTGMQLDRPALESLMNMVQAAQNEGITLLISSAYRSYNYQEKLFQYYVQQDGESRAEHYSARPGTSQHQLGTCVDFGSITNDFVKTTAGQWLHENGSRFGWSLSYPQGAQEKTGYMWESWHWRYIGPEATAMQKNYFEDSQQDFLEFWSLHEERFRSAWKDSELENDPAPKERGE